MRSRTVQGDASEDRVGYVQFDLSINETLRSKVDHSVLAPEFTLSKLSHLDALDATIARLRRALPKRPVLFLLRFEDAGFRPVNGEGVWVQTTRADVDAPLNPFPPSESLYAQELEGIDSLDEFVAQFR